MFFVLLVSAIVDCVFKGKHGDTTEYSTCGYGKNSPWQIICKKIILDSLRNGREISDSESCDWRVGQISYKFGDHEFAHFFFEKALVLYK